MHEVPKDMEASAALSEESSSITEYAATTCLGLTFYQLRLSQRVRAVRPKWSIRDFCIITSRILASSRWTNPDAAAGLVWLIRSRPGLASEFRSKPIAIWWKWVRPASISSSKPCSIQSASTLSVSTSAVWWLRLLVKLRATANIFRWTTAASSVRKPPTSRPDDATITVSIPRVQPTNAAIPRKPSAWLVPQSATKSAILIKNRFNIIFKHLFLFIKMDNTNNDAIKQSS